MTLQWIWLRNKHDDWARMCLQEALDAQSTLRFVADDKWMLWVTISYIIIIIILIHRLRFINIYLFW